ncbi:hypothetical protein DVA86_28015 [Streptomyces armeniacus]|uniref:Uncharacterized protein n=1 Tax=Streptomyces armeniacus TaxID=83291 RepID=A0A345XW79_9ACTN|nr:hypothetical protein [Streptomyces armeniacus]AXK35895.1 hypothetical protein DVA86_28015 [Streptomyces armeniacus]
MTAVVEQLATLVAALRGTACEDWPDPNDAAGRAGHVMHTALTACGMWEKTLAAHRAAVLTAHAPFRMARPELAELAEYTAKVCAGTARRSPYRTDLKSQFDQAEEVLHRLEALPEGWRQEAVRLVLHDLTVAVGSVQITLNRLDARGIDTDVHAVH